MPLFCRSQNYRNIDVTCAFLLPRRKVFAINNTFSIFKSSKKSECLMKPFCFHSCQFLFYNAEDPSRRMLNFGSFKKGIYNTSFVLIDVLRRKTHTSDETYICDRWRQVMNELNCHLELGGLANLKQD